MFARKLAVPLAACGLALFALAYGFRAQAPLPELPELVGAAASCEEALLLQTTGLPRERLPRGLGHTVLLRGGTLLRPSPGARSRVAAELGVLDRVTILADRGEDKHVFVRAERAQACGWVALDDLLLPDGAGSGRAPYP